MRDLFIPGASYAAATPQGDLVGSMPGTAFSTNGQPIPACPGGGLLAPDAVRIGSRLCVAGHGTSSLRAWLWNGIEWFELALGYGQSQVRFGPRGLYVSCPFAVDNVRVYDPLTGEHVDTITKPLGIEGIARVTGAGVGPNDIHPAKEWYGRDGFAFYTTIDNVTIGQGVAGGIVAHVDGGPVKQLLSGDCQFVVFNRDGDALSIAVSKFAEKQAGGLWPTVAELRALPDVVAPIEPPPIIVVPPVVPTEPKPVDFPNILATLEAVRAQYPAFITTEQAVDILNRTAWGHPGFGLLAKPNGNHGPQPTTGVFCSADWLVHLPSGRGSDCFVNGPSIDAGNSGSAETQWNDEGEPFDVSRFVAPVAPSDVGPGDPGERGPATGLLRIDTALLEGVLASLVADTEALAARVAVLEARAPTTAPTLTRVAIKTDDGYYLCAEDGGGGAVNATRTAAGGWETFTLEPR